MPEYQFKARDASGKEKVGVLFASSIDAVASQLQEELLIPIEIVPSTQSLIKNKEKKSNFFLKFNFKFKKKTSQDELHMFCRQMYALLKAGIPIVTAVTRLSETSRDPALAKALTKLITTLNEGKTLSQGLILSPEIFTPFFINLVKIGENTGRLDQIFLHLAQYISLETNTKKKFTAALRYPLLVIVAALVALLVINAFVVPAFADMFKGFKGTLPLPTRILIGSSYILTHYWYLILFIFIAVLTGFRYYTKTPSGQLNWSYFILRLPIIGEILNRIILTRFAQLFSLALRSGLPAIEAIELVGNSTGNAYIASKIKTITSLIARGNTIANSIAKSALFPPLVLQMVSVGEESGNIDTLLDEVASFYKREVDYDLERLNDAIEPIMLLLMGIIVLILALGVFLPMWDMASQAQANI